MKGEGEVREILSDLDDVIDLLQEDIKKEFDELDADRSGFITKGLSYIVIIKCVHWNIFRRDACSSIKLG